MIDWMDLYFKDLGESQIENGKELTLKQKKMKSFYTMILLPLYTPIKDNKRFKFSTSDDKLTIRIMYKDLKKYYDLKNYKDVLYKIAELNPSFESKVEPLLKKIEELKSE